VWGIWDVEALTTNGADQPLLVTDSTLLKRVVFGGLNRATFRRMADSVERYALEVDSVKHELTLTGRFDPKNVRTMTYAKPDLQARRRFRWWSGCARSTSADSRS
jgi:hypothetical protein